MKKQKECVLVKSGEGHCIRAYAQTSRSFDASGGGLGGVDDGSFVAERVSFASPEIPELPLRKSAEQLIVEAMEAELRLFRAQFGGLRDEHGREMIVRNGFQPPRKIDTVIGRVDVRIPKLRRRDGNAVMFRSVFIPRYVRRTETVDSAKQCKYLNALRMCNVTEALEALFNGRIRYVPTSVMEHLREWWAQHCAEMLDQLNVECFEGGIEV